MSDEADRQSILDEEHLKLLSLGYWVSGGFAAMFSSFGVMYAFIGLGLGVAASHADGAGKAGEAPPAFIGWLLLGIGVAVFLFAVSIAVVKFWTAVCIRRRKSRTFCMVVAGITCLEFPYGTLLGVLTFMVLGRASVARAFGPSARDEKVAA